MQGRAVTAPVPQHAGRLVPRAIAFTVLVLILLTWSSSANSATPSYAFSGDPQDNPAPNREQTIEDDATGDDGTDTESVTMSIPLEENGVIDVEAPPMGVKIEKWDGDEVLVIVEKKKRAKPRGEPNRIDPVNIQITREGKNVRIETTGGSNWRDSGMDLSFRIVLPESYEVGAKTYDKTDGVARLTGALWRTVHREALRWLAR